MAQARHALVAAVGARQLIPEIPPVSADSLAFAALALVLIALGWSRARRWFPAGLALGSLLMLSTWLKPLDFVALALFVVPPYLLIRRIWGSRRPTAAAIIAAMILWEVLLFIYLRKYEWVGEAAWLDHPVAVIGLSYMLFRIIHLIVEAPHLGHLPIGPVRYCTYLIAFWTLLSGPIQRYEAFCEGLESVGRPDETTALSAAHRLVNGLIKAFVFAPVLLKASDIGALTAPGANGFDLAIVLYAYPAYLYLNFAGYTDMVIAIARLCGVNTLPENFNRPYLARNVLDFWSRWHISFGDWIRHYVFIPLSKHLVGATPPSAHNAMLAISVIITFLIVGAWHGTTINFVIFGLLHAGAIIVVAFYGRMLKALFSRTQRRAFESHVAVRTISTILCFHFVAATVLLFPNSVSALGTALGAFFG